MPDAHCLHCGRPITYRRLKGRVYKAKYCPGAQCRKAHFRNKHKTDPTPRKMPPPPIIPEEDQETALTASIQDYTQAQILTYLETCRLPNNVKMDIWEDWKAGQIPAAPPAKTEQETFSSDQPLTDDEQDQILPTVAVELTRLREKNKAVKGAPGVLRRRVPEGGGGA